MQAVHHGCGRWLASLPLVLFVLSIAAGQTQYDRQASDPVKRDKAAGGRVPGPSAPLSPDRVGMALQRFLSRQREGAWVLLDASRHRAQTASGFLFDVAGQTDLPAALVGAFLASEPELFGPGPEGAEIKLSRTEALQSFTIHRFDQLHQGLPVLGGYLIAHVNRLGSLCAVADHRVRAMARPLGTPIARQTAVSAALQRLRAGAGATVTVHPRSQLALVQIDAGNHLVWDLWLRVASVPHRVLVDALTAKVLGSSLLLRTVDCVPRPLGRAFRESPVKGQPELLELDDLECNSALLDGEFIRTFQWIGSFPFTFEPRFEYHLRGSLVDGQVTFQSEHPAALAQATIFHHASRFHAWVRKLGFTALDRPFPTVANAHECFGEIPCDNAYYDPLFEYSTGFGILVFGEGSFINFGLEADVICHEYTHGVVAETASLGADFFDPRAFYSLALNEAFADYFSSTFVGDPRVGEYSGPAFGHSPLRNLDNSLRWPEGIDPNSFHDTGQIWSGALWDVRQALSQQGTDPTGVELADRLAYATLASLASNADFLAAGAGLLAAAQSSGMSPAQVQTVREVLEGRGLAEIGGKPPRSIRRLAAGTMASGDISAALGGGARLADVLYEVVVPDQGSRLVIEVTADANVDLYVRARLPVEEQGNDIVASLRAESPSDAESVDIRPGSSPPLAGGSWFIGIANRTQAVASYQLKATLEVTSFETLLPLTSAVPASGRIESGPRFAPVQYTFSLPPDTATVRARFQAEADGDIDLYLRFGKPVEEGLEGQVLADVVVASGSSIEQTALDGASIPGLESGTYYLAVRSLTTASVEYTVEASLENVPPPPLTTAPLLPGAPQALEIDGAAPGTLRLAGAQYAIEVPGDGARLVLKAASQADVALYLRHDSRVAFEAGRLEREHTSDVVLVGEESLIVSLFSTPRLQPGTYFLAIANHSSSSASVSVSAELTAAPINAQVQPLSNAVWTDFVVPGTGGQPAPTLAATQFRLQVTANAPGLDVIFAPDVAGDVDMYVRKDRPVQSLPEGVVADHFAETSRGAEAITVFKEELSPGDYYIAFGSRSPAAVPGSIFTVFSGPVALSAPLTDLDYFEDSLSAAQGGCLLGLTEFAIDVPANATQLEIIVEPLNGGPLNVLVRHGSRIVIDLGDAIFDQQVQAVSAPIVFAGAELKPGKYFVSVVNCQPRPQRFLISRNLRIPGNPQQVLDQGHLLAGLASGALSGDSGRMHVTQYLFTVQPEDTEAVVSAWGGDCAEVDIDLFLARDVRVTWQPNEATNAGWKSLNRRPGAETIIVNADSDPPLLPGTYYAAIVNRSPRAVPFTIGALSSPLTSVRIESVAEGTSPTSGTPGLGALAARQFRLELAPGATRLELRLSPTTLPTLDIDLHARLGIPVIVGRAGFPLADRSSEAENTGVEAVAFPGTEACLRAGTYFLTTANFTADPVPFRIEATVESAAPRFRRGDANRSRLVDLSDAVAILNYLFTTGAPICLDAADIEENDEINLSDAVKLLSFLFLGGPAPGAPFPDCGTVDRPALGGCGPGDCD